MFLSRLILNLYSKDVRRDLADCHELHRTVLRAFPQKADTDAGARKHFGLLFRVGRDTRTGRINLYVQSQTRPDWTSLPPGYLLETTDGLENPACRPVDQVYGRLREGTVLSFELRANPTRKVGTSSRTQRLAGGPMSNGRRVSVRDAERQIEWLRQKGVSGGFELMSVDLNPTVADVDARSDGRIYGSERVASGFERKLTFDAVNYRGHLRITDASRFYETLADGIGSGKAFGFGLLCLAPVR